MGRAPTIWERDGDTYYARVDSDAAIFHLIVEPLSPEAWDWQVWPQGAGARPAWHGITLTRQDAMRAAECVAGAWI
jgi:hypothetical protein